MEEYFSRKNMQTSKFGILRNRPTKLIELKIYIFLYKNQ